MYTSLIFFFFNDTATTEIYTLSLHDALPISAVRGGTRVPVSAPDRLALPTDTGGPTRTRLTRKGCLRSAPLQPLDRKSTRLNSSHANISYAVFCLKKKKS